MHESARTLRPARLMIPATVEQVLLAAALFWTLAANRPFFAAALDGRGALEPATWGFVLALAGTLTALHFLLLALVANRWTLKPLLALLTVVTALAMHYMQRLGIYLDPSMLRNVVHTDLREASELLSWGLLPHLLLYAALPLAVLSRVRIVQRPWARAAALRLAVLLLAAGVGAGALVAVFQPFASLMRNRKEVRYLITPSNYLWSAAAVALADARGAARPRQPIGLDAAPGPSWASRTRPTLVVLVVGETARAANWGLNGYARQTTPQLAQLPVVNFTNVTSCGTSTEVSLPCMFAPVGRRDYDESRIRGSESLLHVLSRAGVQVHWRDNQSGCKGVCEGLPGDSVQALGEPTLCSEGRCPDEGLLHGLDQRLARARGTQLLVLHPMGNHGPAYSRRYPPALGRFQPACQSDDLRRCSREQIVNAYDNALLYTDHWLARLIDVLQSHSPTLDSALLYVSDHGESLGENGLYLHGLPHAIAPVEQTSVPMLLWMSDGFSHAGGIDRGCLQRAAAQPAGHDHLFHTLLGLTDVRTALYEPAWDLVQGCRMGAADGTAH
jgi:lipid A ethanolaminephosphotransferase